MMVLSKAAAYEEFFSIILNQCRIKIIFMGVRNLFHFLM